MRIFVGALAGFAIGAAVWIFGVSDPRLGLRILLECVGAAWVIAMSIETDDYGEIGKERPAAS
jgi:hypothetical protein